MSRSRTEDAEPLSQDYVEQVRRIAPALSPESFTASLALCRPRHSLEAAPDARLTVSLDLRYGPHERHLLDLHLALAGGSTPPPMVLFVHGGGFIGGNRRITDTYLYTNIATWANSHGFAAALMSYRLAPAATWPAGAQDVGRALDWLARNANDLGISTQRLVVIGHSAGATHVASWLVGKDGPAEPHGFSDVGSQVCGAILLSGIYQPSQLPFPGSIAYYGENLTSQHASTLEGISRVATPVMLVAAELDPPEFLDQWRTAVTARTLRQGAVHSFLVPNQNHFTSVNHLGAEPDALGIEMARFVRAATKHPAF